MKIMMHNSEIYPQAYARIAGALYLLIIIAGALGQLYIRGSLIIPGDAVATVNNLTAFPLMWRIGVFGDILMHVFDIPLMVILYVLFKPVNRNIALLGLAFNLIQTAVLVVNKLTLVLPLLILNNAGYLASFEPSQINSQIMLLTDLHNYGFGFGLIFFGFACLAYGYLIVNSSYFPKITGIFIAAAGLCYLINSFTLILAPEYSPKVFPILVICLLAELSFCLYLLIKGLDQSEWDRVSLQGQ